MSEQVFVIEGGQVATLYSDSLPKALGTQKNARASHVEPGEDGGWDVVLTDHPRNGSFKGHVVARGVGTRKEALSLEVNFINSKILGDCDE